MSAVSPPIRPAPTAAELPLYRLSDGQYAAMLQAGVLWQGCPVELLDGLLVEKRPHLRDDDPTVNGEQLPVYRLRVDDFLAMHDHAIITDNTPVELIQGLLVETMVRHPPHDAALGLLQDALSAVLPPDWILRIQSALQLTDTMPEPDAAIIRGSRRDFVTRHPTNQECRCVIEISDSTLSLDRSVKQATYATHSITEYWIVNLPDEQIEVYREPSGLVAQPEYRSLHTFRAGDSIPLNLDGAEVVSIPVNTVLP